MSGRKTKVVAITVDGRDKGKHFLIYEMPASAAEEWAMQALLLAAQSGAQIPPDVMGAGMAGLVVSTFCWTPHGWPAATLAGHAGWVPMPGHVQAPPPAGVQAGVPPAPPELPETSPRTRTRAQRPG